MYDPVEDRGVEGKHWDLLRIVKHPWEGVEMDVDESGSRDWSYPRYFCIICGDKIGNEDEDFCKRKSCSTRRQKYYDLCSITFSMNQEEGSGNSIFDSKFSWSDSLHILRSLVPPGAWMPAEWKEEDED